MQNSIIIQPKNYLQKINNKKIFNNILSFLDEQTSSEIKAIIKNFSYNKLSYKERITQSLKKYVLDFGKNNEKVKYFKDKKGILKIYTNIFNIRPDFLSKFTSIIHKNEKIELNKEQLFQYLRLSPENDLFLSDSEGSKVKISKYINS